MITDRIKKLPKLPGIYIFKDKKEKIIYVGKAKSIKSRVLSYFQKSVNQSPKNVSMVQQICNIDCIVTNTEMDALILESNLIKKYKPKYNIILRDDKHFPYLRLSVNQPFPDLQIVRRVIKDGALYFGPYTPAGTLRTMYNQLYKIFPLRKSKDILDPKKKRRPCLNYQIGKCLAPCAGHISQNDYDEIVRGVLLFLKGQRDDLIDHLFHSMKSLSDTLDFEKAAIIRDQIKGIKAIMRKQQIISVDTEDQDVISGYPAEDGETIHLQMLFIRNGKLIGKAEYQLLLPEDNYKLLLYQFIKQYYGSGEFIPQEVIIHEEIEDAPLVEKWLTQLKGARVRLIFPKIGRKLSLINLATQNARISSLQKIPVETTDNILACLQQKIGLPSIPRNIEAFDISNISGTYAVGSMVCFTNGKKDTNKYRRYKIKGSYTSDDYKMITEVVYRRYRRCKKDQKPIPDLIIIDGGKGQLTAALNAFNELNLDTAKLIGIAKGKERNKVDTDEIFSIKQDGDTVVYLKRTVSRPAKLLLAKIRDEAHRFAITYHRSLRGKSIRSELDDISGIGKGLRVNLLRHFKSLSAIKEADITALMAVSGISEKKANSIISHFK